MDRLTNTQISHLYHQPHSILPLFLEHLPQHFELSLADELAQALARALSAHLLLCQVREGHLRRQSSQR